MKRTTRFALIAVVFTAVALAPVAPAVAGGISINIGGHGHHGGHHYKRHGYGYRHGGHHYKRGYSTRHGYRSHSGYGYRSHSGHGYRSHSGHGKHCKPVHKFVPDGYGGGTKIGGTMCYDHYGNGYVVPGSRYIIADY